MVYFSGYVFGLKQGAEDDMQIIEFRKMLNGLLQPKGFIRGKGCWIRKKDGLVTVVSIEKHPYGPWYSVHSGAEIEHRSYSNKEVADDFDVRHSFVFSTNPNDLESYKQIKHELRVADRVFAEFHLDLSIFSEQDVREMLNYNIATRLMPMMDILSLKKLINDDIHYVRIGCGPRLYLYDVPQNLIDRYCLRKKG